MTPILAHAGHYTGLVFAAPVIVLGALFGWDVWRERRRGGRS